jgi:hypothetical protein
LNLAVAGKIDKSHPLQQANQYLLVLLAHAQEDDENVRIACRRATVTALTLMTLGNSEASAAVARLSDRNALRINDEAPSAKPALFDETTLNDFGIFWVAHFSGKISDLFTACMGYFECPQPALRLAAASIAGIVLKHVPAEDFSRTNAEQLCAALMRLARNTSGSAELRTRATRALGVIPVV